MLLLHTKLGGNGQVHLQFTKKLSHEKNMYRTRERERERKRKKEIDRDRERERVKGCDGESVCVLLCFLTL